MLSGDVPEGGAIPSFRDAVTVENQLREVFIIVHFVVWFVVGYGDRGEGI